jgi:NAD kinase
MKQENALQSEEQTVSESENSRSVVTTKRMVTSTRVIKHTTSSRIVTADGETVEAIEGFENLQIQNGDEKVGIVN